MANVIAENSADIKQYRRRTHQSGPLGELFDHGMYAEIVGSNALSNVQAWTL
jgi:hypothetical protein